MQSPSDKAGLYPGPPVKRSLSTSHPTGSPLATAVATSKVPRVDASVVPSPFSASRRSMEKRATVDHRPHPSGRGRGHRNVPSSHPHSSRLAGPSSGPLPRASKRLGFGKKLELPGPFHDEAHVTELYNKSPIPIKEKHTAAPKGTLANFCSNITKEAPKYSSENGIINRGGHISLIWRSTVTVPGVDPLITATGDASEKKEAERIAALGALFQLQHRGLLDQPKKSSAAAFKPEITLSDGSVINYERARNFMDYYCRRYKFGKVDLIQTQTTGGGPEQWETIMEINKSRIGVGKGPSKQASRIQCYLDVTQYLQSCDPGLWNDFVEAAKSGADLGMAPRVRVSISNQLDEAIQDLCYDIRTSSLFRKRPAKIVQQPSEASAAAIPTSGPGPNLRLEPKSKHLLHKRQQYLVDPAMEKMRNTRQALPVYTRSKAILDHISDNEVTICMAATGSGKTTQIPQLILDDHIDRGIGAECNIICTQPRRLAAISVAHRVSAERGEELGGSIGYQVRFEQKLPEEHGSVTFCTTGVFLKRLQSVMSGTDPRRRREMDRVTHIIVDEVHERDVDTDLLLVVLKRIMEDRKARNLPLKIVLMSATVDPTLFQSYFKDDSGNPAQVIDVPGRAYPVEKRFMDDFIPKLISGPSRWLVGQESVSRYIYKQLGAEAARNLGINPANVPSDNDDLELPYPLIAATIAHALQSSDDGHVLVFLPGWDEIMATQRALQQPLGPLPIDINNTSKYSVHLLHSTVPLQEQQVIFEPPPPGVRRVILATNIAETSVTIPDVVYVVDSAKVKETRYEPQRHMSALVSAWVGNSNLHQRAGRAGRHRPGIYYGILSKAQAASLRPHQTVEMKRSDLSNVVMHVKALNFPGMSVQEVLAATIEPPEAERVEAALKNLHMVGAIDAEQTLTPLGKVLLVLPVDAQMGRLVLYGAFFKCLDQALTLAAILSNRDPFVSPLHLKKESTAKKNSWAPEGFRSDPLATLRAFNAWWDLQSKGQYVAANQFCFDNFLTKPTLLLIQKVKQQLLQAMDYAGVLDVSAGGRARMVGRSVPPELNINGECWPLLAALVAVASQPRFALRTGDVTLRTATDRLAFIHPSSVNNRRRQAAKESPDAPPEEKALYAYAEKRQNISQGQGSSAQTFLVTTTRLDPLIYLLFGAYNAEIAERGLECDRWLPVVGDVDTLDNIQRLKTYMEDLFLRVYEGIVASRNRMRETMPLIPRERESEDDYDYEIDRNELPLSNQEIQELDRLTQSIVQILRRYSEERMESQSRSNSRPATPMTSPGRFSARLPGGSQTSGYNTPFQSRPGTPSSLAHWW